MKITALKKVKLNVFRLLTKLMLIKNITKKNYFNQLLILWMNWLN